MPGQPTKPSPSKPPPPIARPAAADRRRGASVAAAPLPSKSSKSSGAQHERRDSHWKLIASLLILPVLAGAATVYRIGFQFQGTGHFAVDCGVAVDRTAPNAAESAPPIDPYRLALIDSAWNCGQDAARMNRKPVDWSVSAGDGSADLTLVATGPSPAHAEKFIHSVAQLLQERLKKLAEKSAQEMDEQVRPLMNWRGDVETMLASLPAESSAQESAHAETLPIERIEETWTLLDEQRAALQQIRFRLAESVNQRTELASAPPPEAVAVDPAVRQEAYAEHVGLQEDLRHLKLQLEQVRRAMRNVWQAATPSLDETVSLSGQLAKITQMRESVAWQGEARARLERIMEVAGEFATEANAFHEDWTRDFTRVESLNVEPQAERPPLLMLHDKISHRAADYMHEAELLLAKIRVRLRSLEQLADDQQGNPAMQAEAAKYVRGLEEAQQRFSGSADELTSRDNYLLDAALNSARGLLHRTRDIRRGIDQALENRARQELLAVRGQQLKSLDGRIAALEEEERASVAKLLAIQDNLKAQMDLIPGYLNRLVTKSDAATRRDLLMRHRDSIDQLISSRRSAGRPTVNPNDVKLANTSLDKRPVNLRNVASYGLLAWSLTFLGLLGMHRLVFARRR